MFVSKLPLLPSVTSTAKQPRGRTWVYLYEKNGASLLPLAWKSRRSFHTARCDEIAHQLLLQNVCSDGRWELNILVMELF